MTKTAPPNSDLPSHVSFATSALGSIMGAGIGALFGPELSLISGGIGSAVGGSIGYLGTQLLTSSSFGKITLEELIAAKTYKDFNYSVLHEPSLIRHTRDDSKARIDLLSEIKKMDFARLTPAKEVEWLLKNHRNIMLASANKEIPDEYKKIADAINKEAQVGKRLKISCECIEPAGIAILKSLAHHSRLGLDIEIDYQDTCGVYQVQNVAAQGGEVDFLITANAPFFLDGFNKASIQNYNMAFEIHGEEQVLLRRKTMRMEDIKRIHVFSNSSAEEEFIVKHKVYASKEMFSHYYYEELTKVLSDLEPGEVVIAWEPLATVLSQNRWVKRSEDVFLNWISLFAHNRWNNHKHMLIYDHFKKLFIFEWLHCHTHRPWSVDLLLKDKQFVDRFRIGSGMEASSIFDIPNIGP